MSQGVVNEIHVPVRSQEATEACSGVWNKIHACPGGHLQVCPCKGVMLTIILSSIGVYDFK